jgi:hypothetical protein
MGKQHKLKDLNTEANMEEGYEQYPFQNQDARRNEGSRSEEESPADAEATKTEGLNLEEGNDDYERVPSRSPERIFPMGLYPQRLMGREKTEEVNREASIREVSVANTNIAVEEDVQMSDSPELNSRASFEGVFDADEGNANVSMEENEGAAVTKGDNSEDMIEVVEEAVVPKQANSEEIIEIHDEAPAAKKANAQEASTTAARQRQKSQKKDEIVNIREWLL